VLPRSTALRERIRSNNEKAKEKKNRKTLAHLMNYYGIPLDFEEFAAQCRIRSGIEIVPFRIYDYQKLLHQIMSSHEGTMIIKDRQLGITETFGAWLLHEMLKNSAFLCAVFSINQAKSSEVSKRISAMTAGMDISWQTKSLTILKPMHSGEAQCLPSTDNAGRSLPSVAVEVFDEAGFIDGFTELYGNATSAQEMIDPKDRRTVINTTIPETGELHEVWTMFDSENGDISAHEMLKVAREGGTNCGIPGMVWWVDGNGWAKVVLSHKVHPKYGKDPEYLNNVQRRRKIPWSTVQREHNLGIETAQGSLFSSDAIAKQSIGAWAEYKPGRYYIACTDPNFGGSDNWVTQIWDVTELPYSLVAEYAESDRTTEYSRAKALELSDNYNVIYHAVESNSGGKIVVENMIRDRPSLKILLTLTTNTSKKVNTDRIALGVEQGEYIYPADWKGIIEMKRFSQALREGTGGEKDDRVMCFAAGMPHLDQIVFSSFDSDAVDDVDMSYLDNL
jgi:Terminase RNaseH-like domain